MLSLVFVAEAHSVKSTKAVAFLNKKVNAEIGRSLNYPDPNYPERILKYANSIMKKLVPSDASKTPAAYLTKFCKCVLLEEIKFIGVTIDGMNICEVHIGRILMSQYRSACKQEAIYKAALIAILHLKRAKNMFKRFAINAVAKHRARYIATYLTKSTSAEMKQ